MQSMGGAEEHLERKGQLFGRSLDATDAEAPPSNAVSCSEDRRRCWRPSPALREALLTASCGADGGTSGGVRRRQGVLKALASPIYLRDPT